jgi:hypothetical protein
MVHNRKSVITSAYLGFNLANVGGYSFVEDENTKGFADFVENKKVLKIAKENDLKKVHLAGDWSKVGQKGFGERVLLDQAKKLLKKKKEIGY